MGFQQVEYEKIQFLPPEGDACIVLHWTAKDRYIPIWISNEDALVIAAREDGAVAHRPHTHDVLSEVLHRLTSGVSEVRLTSYYEGVFIASLQLHGGEEVDCRPSDAIAVARLLDLPILVDDDVLAQSSLHISSHDLETYFGIQVSEPEESIAPLSEADMDFEKFLAEMGVNEKDLFGDDSEKDDNEKD